MRRFERRKNANDAGHAHALTFSCYKGFEFLRSDRTCRWLRDATNAARVEHEFDLWAYVFMPEHVHLNVRPRRVDDDMARIRHGIKSSVGTQAVAYIADKHSEWLPKISRTRGKRIERLFWQSGGGYDRNITSSAALLAMIEYIHLNPVRRHLVTKAIDWKWSSAAWYEHGTETPLRIDPIPPKWLLID